MSLQAVFIDVGNTLLYEEPSRFEIYAQSAREQGLDVSTEAMSKLMYEAHEALPRTIEGAYRYSDPWFRSYIRRIFHERLGVAEERLEELQRQLFARFSDPGTFRTFPGTLELLERLHERGLRLSVISNWSPRLPRLLEALDLTRYFDFVLSSAIEEMEKPEPAIFERALELAGVAPEDALHAGDHPRKDVDAAERAGLFGVLVDHAGAMADAECPRVTSFAELATLIDSRIA